MHALDNLEITTLKAQFLCDRTCPGMPDDILWRAKRKVGWSLTSLFSTKEAR